MSRRRCRRLRPRVVMRWLTRTARWAHSSHSPSIAAHSPQALSASNEPRCAHPDAPRRAADQPDPDSDPTTLRPQDPFSTARQRCACMVQSAFHRSVRTPAPTLARGDRFPSGFASGSAEPSTPPSTSVRSQPSLLARLELRGCYPAATRAKPAASRLLPIKQPTSTPSSSRTPAASAPKHDGRQMTPTAEAAQARRTSASQG
jgi:hypothetical protein